MNGLAFLLAFNWAFKRAIRAAENPPPFPPNYIVPQDSTGVPPPPFIRDEHCPFDHSPYVRCGFCEALQKR